MTADEGPAGAGRREWVGLAVLALPALILPLDLRVLNLALPRPSRDLGAGAVSAADGLTAPRGADLLDGAREAFAAGLSTAAALFVALSVLAATVLRHARSTGEPERASVRKQEGALAEEAGA